MQMNTATTSTSTPTLVQVHVRRHPDQNGWESWETRVVKPDGSWGGGVEFNTTDASYNRESVEIAALAKALRLERAGKPVDLVFTAAEW